MNQVLTENLPSSLGNLITKEFKKREVNLKKCTRCGHKWHDKLETVRQRMPIVVFASTRGTIARCAILETKSNSFNKKIRAVIQ